MKHGWIICCYMEKVQALSGDKCKLKQTLKHKRTLRAQTLPESQHQNSLATSFLITVCCALYECSFYSFIYLFTKEEPIRSMPQVLLVFSSYAIFLAQLVVKGFPVIWVFLFSQSDKFRIIAINKNSYSVRKNKTLNKKIDYKQMKFTQFPQLLK